MTEKYHCETCGRRFVDWGAKKLEYKCPTEGCDQAALILVGSDNLHTQDKRKTKHSKKAAAALTNPEVDLLELESPLTISDDTVLDDEHDTDLDDDDEDNDQVKLDKETPPENHYPENSTERTPLMGDTKGKKEKSKAQKQKTAKDTSAAKIKKDKAPKAKSS